MDYRLEKLKFINGELLTMVSLSLGFTMTLALASVIVSASSIRTGEIIGYLAIFFMVVTTFIFILKEKAASNILHYLNSNIK